jgi:putative zinc finger/helix-turn-helix YgiT family protein
MQKPSHHPTPADAPERLTECFECGSTALEERFDEETFEYGGREKPFTVTARIPSLLCRNCGYRFYDDTAEWARHAAACRHLGVMIPDEILALRERYGLTQEALAALTGIGVASLGRWERGAGIQNEGYDALLYLLTFAENVERLRSRRQTKSHRTTGQDATGPKCPECEHGRLVPFTRDEEFDYEREGETIKVVAKDVPVERCDSCGMIASGPAAAKVRAEAVCRASKTKEQDPEPGANRLRGRFPNADVEEASRLAPAFRLTPSKRQLEPSTN